MAKKLPSLRSDHWQVRHAEQNVCPPDRQQYRYQTPRGTRVDIVPACQISHRYRSTGWHAVVSRWGSNGHWVTTRAGRTDDGPQASRYAARFSSPSSAKVAVDRYFATQPASALDGAPRRRARR
jgi:hypothetical protein